MIHCLQCKRKILHGAPFVRYSAFAYCSNECLYQYSLAPNSHVWSDYARAIDPETDGYDDVYADVEREEETLRRNVETVVRMMRATRAKNAQAGP